MNPLDSGHSSATTDDPLAAALEPDVPGSAGSADSTPADEMLLDGRFLSVDVNGGVTAWSARAERTFGWARPEAAGRPLGDVVANAASREELAGDLSEVLAGGRARRVQLTGVDNHAREFPAELALVPIRLAEGYAFNALLQDLAKQGSGPEAVARLRSEHDQLLASICAALEGGEVTEASEDDRLVGALVLFEDLGPARPVIEAGDADAPAVAAVDATLLDDAKHDAEQAWRDAREATERADEASAAAEAARVEAEKVRAELDGSRRELEGAHAEAEELRAELKRAEVEAERLRTGVEETSETAAARERELAEARATIERIEPELEQARAEVERVGGELAEAREELGAELEQVRASLAEVEEQLAAARDATAAADAKAEEQLAAAEALSTELEASRSENEQLRGDLEAAQVAAAEAGGEVEATQKAVEEVRARAEETLAQARAEADEQLAAARDATAAADAKAEELNAELEASRSETEQLRANLEAAQVAAAEAGGEVEATQKAVEEVRARAEETLAEARAEADALRAELAEARADADEAAEANELAEAAAEIDVDPITGLFNKRHFEEELSRKIAEAARHGGGGAALLLNLQDFEGGDLPQEAGEELLRTVAGALREQLRNAEVLARLSGDEFAVLLPEADADKAQTVAEQLVQAIGPQLVQAGDQSVRITLNVGVALFDERDHHNGPVAVGAVGEGSDGANLPVPVGRVAPVAAGDDEPVAPERVHQAIEQDLFLLYCQPVVDMRTNEVAQYELLLRMVDEKGNLILPRAFLQTAQESGLIRKIDQWVVRRAVALLAERARTGRQVRLEINISHSSIDDPDLVAVLEHELISTGADPASLILEVAEAVAVADHDNVKDFAKRVRALGCKFAVDNFGAAVTSFRYIKDLPLDFLKLDGDLVATLPESRTDQLVIKAIVDIARGMTCQTIAEMVSDDETLFLLRQQGVDFAQGYQVGRPQPITEV